MTALDRDANYTASGSLPQSRRWRFDEPATGLVNPRQTTAHHLVSRGGCDWDGALGAILPSANIAPALPPSPPAYVADRQWHIQ